MAEPELSDQQDKQKSLVGVADKISSFGGAFPPRWRFRLRLSAVALLSVAAFIGYAGYARQSVEGIEGKTSFADSPGFIRFTESSGIAGLVDISAGIWRGLRGKAAPGGAKKKSLICCRKSLEVRWWPSLLKNQA